LLVKKLLCLIIGLAFQGFILNASNVNTGDAKKTALKYYAFYAAKYGKIPVNRLKVSDVIKEKENGETLFYAINFRDGGFILISAENVTVPVLGFSFEGGYASGPKSPAFHCLLNDFKHQIQEIRKQKIPQSEAIRELWKLDALAKGDCSAMLLSCDPLINSNWDQIFPYNALCPPDINGPGGFACGWCGSAATSQLMHYYKYPRKGSGSNSYYDPNYGNISADFGATTYHWNAMPNKLEQLNEAVATLIFHIGVAADIEYGPEYSMGDIDSIRSALLNNFDYSDSIDLRIKAYYTDQEWQDMLMANLDAKMPLLYYGMGDGGHAWLVDGYLGSDYYHCNWNWSGYYDGYFYLNDLSPGPYNFSYGNGAIFNACPKPANYPYFCQGTDTLNFINGQLDDGSGPIENYADGHDCYWLIAPESPTGIENILISFEKFATEAGHDLLTIYDGPNSNAEVLGSFSGETLPNDILSGNDSVLIHFQSDNNTITAAGWLINYQANEMQHCQGTQTFIEKYGIVSDGSGGYNYSNGAYCTWIIQPENASFIKIVFNEFDTEENKDMFNIYDITNGNELLGSFSGSSLPPDLTANGKIRIEFYSDNNTTATGWQLEYFSDGILGQGEDISTSFRLHPNPANDQLQISTDAGPGSEVVLVISDGQGRVVFRKNWHNQNQLFEKKINIEGLQTGVYLLKLKIGSMVEVRKFIKY
jgi:Peptidase C10 family/CUB domain/Secretion system C-terminal sorting domain/Spi protease inhibitor